MVWEKSQGVPQTPASFISPAVVGITMVIPPLFVLHMAKLSPPGTELVFPVVLAISEHKFG